MQDEQLQRIESRFDGIDSRVDGVDSKLGALDDRVGRIESKIDVLDDRVGRIASTVDDLRNRMDEGQRHMHVLHEDLVDRITALAPDFEPIRRELRSEIAELHESTDRRLVPLEAAERMRRRPKR